MKSISSLVMTILWVVGVIIAQGFWSTLFAFLIPFYAWYLVIGHIIIKYGLL